MVKISASHVGDGGSIPPGGVTFLNTDPFLHPKTARRAVGTLFLTKLSAHDDAAKLGITEKDACDFFVARGTRSGKCVNRVNPFQMRGTENRHSGARHSFHRDYSDALPTLLCCYLVSCSFFSPLSRIHALFAARPWQLNVFYTSSRWLCCYWQCRLSLSRPRSRSARRQATRP